MRDPFTSLAVAALALSAVACAPGATVQDGPLPPAEARTRVQVTNNNWSDMTVYVQREGSRIRLGTVSSMSRQIFNLPKVIAASVGSIRLFADPIGSRHGHVTAPVQVTPGQRVDFTIENHMNISSVSVWNR